MKYKFCPLCAELLTQLDKGYMACKCGFINYNNPIPVVACLIEYMGGIVVVKRGAEPCKGQWCFPCGYVEQFESPRSACVREIEEETGLKIHNQPKLLSVCKPGQNLNNVVIFYEGDHIGGKLKENGEADEGGDVEDVKVFHPEKMPELCFSSHQITFKRWRESHD